MEYVLNKIFDENKEEWIYKPSGDLDIHSSNSFQNEVLRDFKSKPADIVVDGKNLIYVDSTGLGAFVAIYKEISADGYSLAFENLRKFIVKLFKITDMERLFMIRSEFDE